MDSIIINLIFINIGGLKMEKRGLLHDFTLQAIILIPIGIALNAVIGALMQILRIPIFLDNIGTILVAIIAGPWVAVVAGMGENVIQGMTINPTALPFAITALAVGLVAGFLGKMGMFSNIWKTLIVGVIIAVVATAVSSVIEVVVFGGASGHSTTIVTGALLAAGQNLWEAVLTKSIFIETLDKVGSTVIAYIIFRNMSDRFLARHKYSVDYVKKK